MKAGVCRFPCFISLFQKEGVEINEVEDFFGTNESVKAGNEEGVVMKLKWLKVLTRLLNSLTVNHSRGC